MRNIDEYLRNEGSVIRDEIENVLRKMCAGMSNREWSDDMIDKLYKLRIINGGSTMKNNGTAYMIFVLGYDLLQKELTSYDDCPCDLAYEICCDIYDEFLDSEEAEEDKSEYECLQDWIENHPGTISRYIEQNFRLVEE